VARRSFLHRRFLSYNPGFNNCPSQAFPRYE
jgi:hypothetical protein